MAFDRRETITLLIGDFLILVVSLWATLTLRNLSLPSYSYFEANVVPFLPMFAISLAVFYVAGLYEKQTRPIRRVMSVRILGAQITTVAIAAILFFILPFNIAPKTILVLYLCISVVAESAWRFHRMKHELKTENRVPALIVGTGPAVQELYEEVRENSRYLLHFVEHVEVSDKFAEKVARALASGVRVVVLDVSSPQIASSIPALYDRMASGVTFVDFATLYEEIFDRVPLGHIDSTRMLESLPKQRALYDALKRLFDVVLASLGIILATPFVAITALILAAEGRPPFMWPGRIGKGGKVIHLLKLRTMLFDDNGDPELHAKNRVTTFGKFLRKTRIDELPQLWNVLTGELSFIGPRPEFPKIVEVYEREIPYYHMRHLIVPGLSGWAQVRDYDAPRGPADVERTRRKLSFDLYYLKHRSFGLDLIIAINSVRALFAFSGT